MTLAPHPNPGLMKTGEDFVVLGLFVFSEFVALSDRMCSLTPWNGSIAWTRDWRQLEFPGDDN